VKDNPLFASAESLSVLLAHLASQATEESAASSTTWNEWCIRRIDGGWNNRLYRVTSIRDDPPTCDVACKYVVPDARDRAGREYGALCALHEAGLDIAPRPILLERERYALPVVVYEWLDGVVDGAPPRSDRDWQCLVEHLVACHALSPEHTSVPLPRCVVYARSADEGRVLVQQQMAHIPPEAQPDDLRDLATCFDATPLPQWDPPPISLCRADHNTLNLIRRPDAWASVDWENSGWSDPALDVAELITHPAYEDVLADRWDWLIDAYCDLARVPQARARIRAYHCVLLVRWVARLARYLYQVPRGLDQRLVAHPNGRLADLGQRYGRYLVRARRALESGSWLLA